MITSKILNAFYFLFQKQNVVKLKRIFFLFSFSFFCTKTFSQQTDSLLNQFLSLYGENNEASVTIKSISIQGNKKTKDYIIFRELTFAKGQTIPVKQIQAALSRSKENLFNTSLFLNVIVSIKEWRENEVDISISVLERWYIFPLPVFELVTRNFNEWWVQRNRSLSYVNYGMRLSWRNFSGRNDILKAVLINGFTQNYGLAYYQPMSDSKLNIGFSFEASYKTVKEVNFNTEKNKLVLFRGEDVSRSEFSINTGLSLRKGLYKRHFLNFEISDIRISDSIVLRNNNFFSNGRKRQFFPELRYSYEYVKEDSVQYPLRGHSFNIVFLQRGLGLSKGMNLWQLELGYGKYITLGKNLFLSFEAAAKIKLPFDQPYYNLGALGYGNFYLRGHEFYVVDGVASGLLKTTLRKKILFLNIGTPIKRWNKFKLPIKIYAKIYSDVGYSYLKNSINNPLNNRFIYTGGFGIDILTVYDLQIRLEFSFNQLNEKGLFLHNQNDL